MICRSRVAVSVSASRLFGRRGDAWLLTLELSGALMKEASGMKDASGATEAEQYCWHTLAGLKSLRVVRRAHLLLSP